MAAKVVDEEGRFGGEVEVKWMKMLHFFEIQENLSFWAGALTGDVSSPSEHPELSTKMDLSEQSKDVLIWIIGEESEIIVLNECCFMS